MRSSFAIASCCCVRSMNVRRAVEYAAIVNQLPMLHPLSADYNVCILTSDELSRATTAHMASENPLIPYMR